MQPTKELELKVSFKHYRQYFRENTFSNIKRLLAVYAPYDSLYEKYKENYDYLLMCAKRLGISKFYFDRYFDYVLVIDYSIDKALWNYISEFARLLEYKFQRQKARNYYQKCTKTPKWHFISFVTSNEIRRIKKELECHFEFIISNRKMLELGEFWKTEGVNATNKSI